MKLKFGIFVLLFMLAYQQPLKAQQGKKQLLAQNAHANWVSVSPDERWMAFSIIGTSPEAPSGIYITTPDGEESVRITEGITSGDTVGYLWWSPDSNNILFNVFPLGSGLAQTIVATSQGKILSRRESQESKEYTGPFGPWRFDSKAYFVRLNLSSPTSQLAVIDLGGKEIMRSPELTTFTPCPWSVLSPDGKTIIDLEDQQLSLLDSLTFNTVATFTLSKTINCAGWSPDSKMLLVDLGDSILTHQMVVIDTTGKELGSFVPPEELYVVEWSYQSTVLAAISWVRENNTASVTFYTIAGKVMGSAAMYVYDPIMDLTFSHWEPDNTYTILTPQGDLIAVHADGSLANDFGLKADAYETIFVPPISIWSPNKNLLAVASQKVGCCNKEIWIYSADGKLLHTLDNQEEIGSIFWSADSASLIVLGQDQGIWLLTI